MAQVGIWRKGSGQIEYDAKNMKATGRPNWMNTLKNLPGKGGLW